MNEIFHLKKSFNIAVFFDYADDSLVSVSLNVWKELLLYVGSVRKLDISYDYTTPSYVPFYTSHGEIRIRHSLTTDGILSFDDDLKALLNE